MIVNIRNDSIGITNKMQITFIKQQNKKKFILFFYIIYIRSLFQLRKKKSLQISMQYNKSHDYST